MAKWFSFNQKTQRVEEITPSEALFKSSPLLFWTRGLKEWEYGPKALEFFLTPVEPEVQFKPTPVVEEKKMFGPFYTAPSRPTAPQTSKVDESSKELGSPYKDEIPQPSVVSTSPVPVFVPDEVAQREAPRKAKPKRNSSNKKVMPNKPKKISKHITLVTKKKKKRLKKRRR
jgi:hypothetical protein